MKQKKKGLLYLAALSLLLLLPISCASAPEVIEDTEKSSDETTGLTPSREMNDEAKMTAVSAREKAVEAKAPKAAASTFEEAEELMASAESYEAAEDWKNSVDEYVKAADSYNLATATAEEKKAEALAAMKAADEAIAGVEKNAEEAEKEALEGEE